MDTHGFGKYGEFKGVGWGGGELSKCKRVSEFSNSCGVLIMGLLLLPWSIVVPNIESFEKKTNFEFGNFGSGRFAST